MRCEKISKNIPRVAVKSHAGRGLPTPYKYDRPNAVWFVRNEALHMDFQLPTINTYKRNLSTDFLTKKHASSAQYFNLSDKPTLLRLKRGRPHDEALTSNN